MKSKPKNKNKHYVPHQKKRDLKQVPVEVIFAQKLADNNPVLRNRAVKKLQKWLNSRADLLTSDEILRIWKGLHYCFWMSDKPLVQEELAEAISSLIHTFDIDQEAVIEFIKGGLVTEAREWTGIDQWRMDKFMMFLRRFLRQIFNFLAKTQWERIPAIQTVFTQAVISNKDAALGFRLHFTDVFLEELAKIGGENLKSEVILALVEPFANELVQQNGDERLSRHIVERIFQHLMRQSDVGIASEEVLDGDDDDEEENDEEASGNNLKNFNFLIFNTEPFFLGDDNGTKETDDGSESDEEMLVEESLKDPRAGNVSVTLPQLKPDFTKLSDLLFKIGSDQKVGASKRTLLYDLTKQFKDLSQEVYPLIPDMSEEEAKIPKIKPGQVAKRKAKEALKIMENVQKEREDYKKALKRKHVNLEETIEDSSEPIDETTESDNDEPNENDEEVEEESEEIVEEPKAKKQKKKQKPEKISNVEIEKMVEEPPKKKKKKKQIQTEVETEVVEEPIKKKKKKQKEPQESVQEQSKVSDEEKPKKKKKKTKSEKVEDLSETKETNGISEETPKKKKKKKLKKDNQNIFEDVNWDEPKVEESSEDWNLEASIKATKITPKATFLKKAKSQQKAETPNISLLKKEKRRISLAMSENKVSTFNEIDRSMQDSPDIPYQPAKVPKQGVLKSKSASSTPTTDLTKAALMKNTMLNGKSKAAKKLGISSRMMFF